IKLFFTNIFIQIFLPNRDIGNRMQSFASFAVPAIKNQGTYSVAEYFFQNNRRSGIIFTLNGNLIPGYSKKHFPTLSFAQNLIINTYYHKIHFFFNNEFQNLLPLYKFSTIWYNIDIKAREVIYVSQSSLYRSASAY